MEVEESPVIADDEANKRRKMLQDAIELDKDDEDDDEAEEENNKGPEDGKAQDADEDADR